MERILLILSVSLATVLAAIAIVIACGTSPLPPQCPQSIFLGKSTPGVVLIPPGGGAFTTPLGVLPYVTWDNVTPGCARPASSRITFTLVCTDVTGATFTLGPQVFALPTPTSPGAQPAGGTSVGFSVPGTILPSVCTAMGTYEVNFAGGIGAGVLQATGDAQVCFVEPSPADPARPRLDLQLLTPPLPGVGDTGVYRFHAGDKDFIYVRISNNDLENALEIDFESEGRQVAVLPDGFSGEEQAYDAGVFRLAEPGDTYPAAFFFDDGPLPFGRVPGEPGGIGGGRIETKIELEPGEVEIFGIAINSFGACADGSCNERNLCGNALFFDEDGNQVAQDPACVQFNYLVDNALTPRYPGITFDDQIKVGPDVDTQWSPVDFFDGDDLVDRTHKGNLMPEFTLPALQGAPAIQLTGDDLRDPTIPFPGTWSDQITLPVLPDLLHFQGFLFDQSDNFVGQRNIWNVRGLEEQQAPCPLPAFSFQPGQPPPAGGFTTSIIDFTSDGTCGDNSLVQIQLEQPTGPQEIFNGTFGQLKQLAEQDPLFKLDFETCRTLRPVPGLNVLDRPFMVADPPFVVHNFENDAEDPLERAIRILDQLANELEYEVQFEGTGGVAVIGAQGVGTSRLLIDPNVLVDPFDEILGFLIYENAQAVNSPLAVPVLTRRLPPPPPLLPLPDYEFDAPPLAQVGQTYDAGIFIPDLDPQPVDPYFNMEFFIGIETDDPIEFTVPDPFLIVPIDPDTPADELERLGGKFGEDPINRCSEGVWKCGKIEFGDGFQFETELFVDGFESGDVSSWSTGAAADNSQRRDKQQPVGVLPEDKKLPVITEEELRRAIELFNDDEVFDEKTIGLVSERFGIEVPLPPIRGTYFFDEFESFRKQARDAPVTLDGSRCPAPCSGLVLEGGGGLNGLRFEGFPDYGVEVASDSVVITKSEFIGNGAGGLRLDGNSAVIGGTGEDANHFADNGGPGLVVESGDQNLLLYNTFDGNAGLGIDLGGDGVTFNDANDDDAGANTLQNFPELTQVLVDPAGGTRVEGMYVGRPVSRTHTLQFYANDACDASGYGEGAALLGTSTITTDANGEASFSLAVDGTATIGQFVTATATEDEHSRTSEFSACFEVVSGVAREDDALVPTTYALFQNYPNPFNPETTIRFDVPEAGPVRLVVFDLLGRAVAMLVDEVKSAGRHAVVFSARELSSGTYLYRLQGEGFVKTRKLVLLR